MIAINCCHTLLLMNCENTHKDKKYNVIIHGASSFTGQIILEYFLENYPPNGRLKWAISGRNYDKLDTSLKKIIGNKSLDKKIPIIIADSKDRASLDELTMSTDVILSTVGPYAKYGSELVSACAKNGTDYCDLAGESQWIQKMINKNQQIAEQTGARIIHACGFDSIPFDIGVFALQKHAIEKLGAPLKKITTLVRAMRGGASGGTIASILNIIDETKNNRDMAKSVSDPYALNPPDKKTGPDKRDEKTYKYHSQLKTWVAPFIMAGINTRIVRRSNALLEYMYGDNFSYTEFTDCGKNIKGRLKAILITTSLGLFFLFSTFSTTKKYIVQRFLPKPGEGPDKKQRINGFFKLKVYGEAQSSGLLSMTITGNQDPGYGSTSKMISEAALCLALDEIDTKGGVWTPASALGEKLLKRLEENAGLHFNINESL